MCCNKLQEMTQILKILKVTRVIIMPCPLLNLTVLRPFPAPTPPSVCEGKVLPGKGSEVLLGENWLLPRVSGPSFAFQRKFPQIK